MMNAHRFHNWFACTPLLFAALLLSACSGLPNHSPDHRGNYPIKVGSEQVSILITVPDDGTVLAPIEKRRWNRFLRDYVNRGRGAVLVERPASIGLQDDQAKKRIRFFLANQGLGETQVSMTPQGDPALSASTVRLTFSANQAIVPTCGNFKTSMAYNPRNLPFEDLGCATQRNLGLMMADPGDLVKARPFSGIDPERSITTDTDGDAATAADTDTTATDAGTE